MAYFNGESFPLNPALFGIVNIDQTFNPESENPQSGIAVAQALAGFEGGGSSSNGFSPIAKVEQTDNGAIITITDKNGTTNTTVLNGADGYTPVKGTDYFTEVDKTEMVNDVKNVCVAKNQGSSNVGKIHVVGTDGNLILAHMPEGGASGDIIGTLDESNNILLSGNLADGTYTLKYENEDGTYTDVGTLEVGATPEEPEVIINQIPISTDASGNLFVGTNGEKGYKTDYRLSLSSGGETATTDYECTGFIPAKQNDVIRIKNIDLTSENATNIVFYNSDKTPIKGSASTYGLPLYGFFVTSGTEENGVYTSTLDGVRHNAIETGDLAYIRIGSKSITDESILTVNQEIV